MSETKEKRVAQLKACAQDIIERAEELIGDPIYSTGYEITISLVPREAPIISCERRIVSVKAIDLM